MDEMFFKPIGYIHSPYNDLTEIPKSSNESMDVEAELIIDEMYLESMADMKSGEEYMVIFVFHQSEGYNQTVQFRGNGNHMGLFSTHAPNRPNPIGVSTIKIKSIVENKITFNGVDMLNNTPVLDIKKIYY